MTKLFLSHPVAEIDDREIERYRGKMSDTIFLIINSCKLVEKSQDSGFEDVSMSSRGSLLIPLTSPIFYWPKNGIDIESAKKLITNLCYLLNPNQSLEIVDQITPMKRFMKSHKFWDAKDLLRISLDFMLDDIAVVLFCPDFMRYTQCAIEYMICEKYEIPCLFLTHDWKITAKKPE